MCKVFRKGLIRAGASHLSLWSSTLLVAHVLPVCNTAEGGWLLGTVAASVLNKWQ